MPYQTGWHFRSKEKTVAVRVTIGWLLLSHSYSIDRWGTAEGNNRPCKTRCESQRASGYMWKMLSSLVAAGLSKLRPKSPDLIVWMAKLQRWLPKSGTVRENWTLPSKMETSECMLWTCWTCFTPQTAELSEPAVIASPLLRMSLPHPTPKLDDNAEISLPGNMCLLQGLLCKA